MVKRRGRKPRLEKLLKADGTRLLSDAYIAKYMAARARLAAYIGKREAARSGSS